MVGLLACVAESLVRAPASSSNPPSLTFTISRCDLPLGPSFAPDAGGDCPREPVRGPPGTTPLTNAGSRHPA